MLTQVVGRELHDAVEGFRRRIARELALCGAGTFRNPDGLQRTGKNYQVETSYGMLSIIVASIDEHPTKYIHAVTLDGKHYLGRPLRLNISKQVDGSGQAGTVIVTDGSAGPLYICNTGRLTIQKRPLPRDEVLNYFDGFGSLVDVSNGPRRFQAVTIAQLTSDNLFEDIARFVKRVIDFKAGYS